MHERLGRYQFENGNYKTGLAALERAVALAPAHPLSPERAHVLSALAAGLMLVWRYDESLAVCEQALAVARAVGAEIPEVRALGALGIDLAYLGRGEEGVAKLRLALELAEQSGDPIALDRTYAHLTDVLTMLGRPRESARLAEAALEKLRRYGIDETTLVSNWIEALIASGDWDEAERASTAAMRAMTGSYPHHLLFVRANLEAGRGDFGEARAHFEAVRSTGVLAGLDFATAWGDAFVAELDALGAPLDGRRGASARRAGTRAFARDCRDSRPTVRRRTARAGGARCVCPRPPGYGCRPRPARPIEEATSRRSKGSGERSPRDSEHRRLARARRGGVRARPGRGATRLWAAAAAAWERLERPPRTAYCSWRQAEALVAAGAHMPRWFSRCGRLRRCRTDRSEAAGR